MKPSFFNRVRSAFTRRITIGNNITQPGRTVAISTPRRFGQGIDDYIAAVRAADNVDFSQRTRLYDLYNDVDTDTHVISVTQKRVNGIKSIPIEFRRDGVPDDAVNDQIHSPWFLQFIEDAFRANFWGFSLFQFYRNEHGWVSYDLIPRKHVDPKLRLIKHMQSDLSGIPFEEYDDLLLVKGKTDLGLYVALCPWVIWKRQSAGDWAQFSEIFGIPMRKYSYDAADPDALTNCVQAAEDQGGAGVMFVPEGSNLEIIETGNTQGSSQLYSDRIDRCNAEISKAILGNTLTTEASDKGTQALGTVQSKGEDDLSKEDRQFILNLLNYDMIDIFRSLGINTDGGEFVYAEPDKTTPSEKKENLKTLVLDFGLPVDPDVIYSTLSIEKPADFNAEDWQLQSATVTDASPSAPATVPDVSPSGSETPSEQPSNAVRKSFRNRFFARAPKGTGALEW